MKKIQLRKISTIFLEEPPFLKTIIISPSSSTYISCQFYFFSMRETKKSLSEKETLKNTNHLQKKGNKMGGKKELKETRVFAAHLQYVCA
jgi:hypothetical protein